MKTHPASSAAGVLAALALLLVPVDAKPGGGNGGGNNKGGGGSEKGDKGNKGNKGGGADKGNKGGGKGDKEKGPDKAAKNDNKPDKDMSDKGNKGNNGNKGDKPGKNKGEDFSIERAPRFKDEERGAILGYFSRHKDNDGGLPPGLAKNLRRGKPLPPGWQDKVAAGYRIEDDYWDSFTPVPYDWFPELRPEPDYALYYYGDRIVRVYEPRRTVVEVIIVPTIRF